MPIGGIMTASTILTPPLTNGEKHTLQMQYEFLTHMSAAARNNVAAAYKALAYLKAQAELIKANDPAATIDARLIKAAAVEIEASRAIIEAIAALFGVEILEAINGSN
jgi:hypothetical protein